MVTSHRRYRSREETLGTPANRCAKRLVLIAPARMYWTNQSGRTFGGLRRDSRCSPTGDRQSAGPRRSKRHCCPSNDRLLRANARSFPFLGRGELLCGRTNNARVDQCCRLWSLVERRWNIATINHVAKSRPGALNRLVRSVSAPTPLLPRTRR